MCVVLILFALSLTLVVATPVQAKKHLIGSMDLEFNVLWPGPQTDIPDWVGTITFDGDSTEYGMAFFAFGSGKPFGDKPTGMAFFFAEIWKIYDWVELITYIDDEGNVFQWVEYGEILMWGYDYGLTNLANSKYHMNGDVQFDNLYGKYAGRNVHMSGLIEWQVLETPDGPVVAPYKAPGTFRIN
ncbi:MAG: hypothetical protein AM326_11490 [Candidatus Thorarchaeota archaeon SMTZ-45]|nr:MAG: hypothetical protein AM326_11490 [Candidatus Thorarchaeota archaeon SMTZ-45]KXH74472.1 MAG: hypothetical protein AM325_05715 [Candidatus Thorarchaeota archaeon SMTZ1-45]